jgi:hypothetical protein
MLKLTKPVSSARIFKGEQSAFVAGGREVARLAEEGKTYTMFGWKAAALVWNCEAYVFSPNTSLIEQFHRYPDVHDAKEAGVPVMRVSEPVDEITMCALIYDLCAAPNARGLSSYPAEFLTP